MIGILLIIVSILTGINTTVLIKMFTTMKKSSKGSAAKVKTENNKMKVDDSKNTIQYESSKPDESPKDKSNDIEKEKNMEGNVHQLSDDLSPVHSDKKIQDYTSVKEKVRNAIERSRSTVQVEDLPETTNEMITFFKQYKTDNYHTLLNISEKTDTKIVVVGDTHCDLTSVVHMLNKLLAVSEYDYFEKAYFVFIGDYLDRGDILFEYLRLLFGLKRILGDRCIFLKGNHELVYFSDGQLKSRVRPADTIETLNAYCINYPEFMEAFADYFSSLTNYVLVKTLDKTILLVHGSIPKDIYIDRFCFDHETGAILLNDEKIKTDEQEKPVVESGNNSTGDQKIQEESKLESSQKPENEPENENETDSGNKTKIKNDINDNLTSFTKQDEQLIHDILYSMIWGDPVEVERRMQGGEARFEFGKSQFESFADKNKIDMLIRGHQPTAYGFESFFNGRLFTVFSSGGADNKDTYYQNVVDPAFGIIENNGIVIFENVFSTIATTKDEQTGRTKLISYNSLNNEAIPFDTNFNNYSLNKEFYFEH